MTTETIDLSPYNQGDKRTAAMNIRTTISNLEQEFPPLRPIRTLAAIAERGNQHARTELKQYHQYLTELADDLQTAATELRAVVAKLECSAC